MTQGRTLMNDAINAQVEWLEDAARYFEARPTLGEDMAHWANVHNSEMCRKIAATLAVRLDEAAMIEVWREQRKVTIYVDTVIRVWGLDIDSEMSSDPRSLETVQSAFEWLFAKDEAGIRADEREKCLNQVCASLFVLADGWKEQPGKEETATAVSNAAVFICGKERAIAIRNGGKRP